MNVIVAALDTEVREQFWFIDCGNERTLPLSVFVKCELNYWAVNKIVHCNICFTFTPVGDYLTFTIRRFYNIWNAFPSVQVHSYIWHSFVWRMWKILRRKIFFEHVCGEGGGGSCKVKSKLLKQFEHVKGRDWALYRGGRDWGPVQIGSQDPVQGWADTHTTENIIFPQLRWRAVKMPLYHI